MNKNAVTGYLSIHLLANSFFIPDTVSVSAILPHPHLVRSAWSAVSNTAVCLCVCLPVRRAHASLSDRPDSSPAGFVGVPFITIFCLADTFGEKTPSEAKQYSLRGFILTQELKNKAISR